MRKRRPSAWSVCISFALIAQTASAATLWESYQDAIATSPNLQADFDTLQAAQEALPIAVSSLWPQLSILGSVTENKKASLPSYRDSSVTFGLTQAIFNPDDFFSVREARSTQASAEHQFQGQRQAFISELVGAYFSVLDAQSRLDASDAQAHVLKLTLDQVKAKVDAGLVSVTDLYQTQAQYDSAVAACVAAQNAVKIAEEALWVYTGKSEFPLAPLAPDMKFPAPIESVHTWTALAKHYNESLQAQIQTTYASAETLRQSHADAWLPTVTLTASWGYDRNNARGVMLEILQRQSQNSGSMTLAFTWSLFSGGSSWSTVRQQAALYAAQAATEAATYRHIVSKTEQDYYALAASASSVDAYRVSVSAAESSLAQLQAQYRVGSTTIVNVLNGVDQVYQAKLDLATAKYQYVDNWVQLRQDAGMLNAASIQTINRWLSS